MNCEKESALFSCAEEGCVKSFQQYASLEKHLDCGRHKYALEHETLYDKAMTMYATKLEHPIMYEKYNICGIVCQSKLSKFSVSTLQKICAALDLDIASLSGERKQPYIEIIEEVVSRCGCTS